MVQLKAQTLLLRIALVLGTKPGFSFLEIVVVLLILGLIGSVIIPNLQFRAADYQRKELVQKLGALVRAGWQQALQSQQLHRVWFDLKTKIVRLERVIEPRGEGQKPRYEPVNVAYATTQFTLPDAITIKQFFIQSSDALNQPGIKVESVWFYIVPEGLVQEVIINALDGNDIDPQGQAHQFSLIVNPFTAQLSLYESFSKI